MRVLESTPISSNQLLIKTDSQYSTKSLIEWLPEWVRCDFVSRKGQTIKNRSLILYVHALLNERAKHGQSVRLQYIKGHAGHEGNEGADGLANRGCLLPDVPERDWDALRNRISLSVCNHPADNSVKIRKEYSDQAVPESVTHSIEFEAGELQV